MRDLTESYQNLIKENASLNLKIQELGISHAELKQEIDVLRRNEEDFKILISESPDPIFSFTSEGQYRYVNLAFAKGVGKPVEEIMGKYIWDVFDKEEADKRFAALSQVFRTGKEKVIEVRVPQADGDQFYVTTITPIKNEKSEVFFALCSSKNITERKKMEDALRQSEEKYRSIIDQMEDGYFEVDLTGTFTLVNNAECKNLGYSREELIGMNNRQYTDQETQKKVFKAFNELYRTGTPIKVFEYRIIRKDGTIAINELTVTLMRDSKGKAIGFRGVVRDITERKRMEEALRASELRYKAIFESTGTTMLIVDEDMTISLVNDRFEALTGYRRKDVEGKKKWTEFVEKDDLETMIDQHQLRRQESSTALKNYEFRLVCKDGTLKNILLTVDLLPSTKQSIASLVDITIRKHAEKALQESEIKFRDLVEKSIAGVYLLQDDLFKYVNEEFAAIFGYHAEEMINRLSPRDTIPSDDLSWVEQSIRQQITGENKFRQYIFHILTKDKQVRDVEIHSSRTMYNGKPAIIGTVLDITDRLKAQEELRRMSIAIEQAAESIVIMDPEGVIQYVNPAFETTTGYSRSEVIGKPPIFLRSDVHSSDFYKNINNIITNGNVWKGRIINKRKDGNLTHEDTTISPMITSMGKLMGYVSLKRDVTKTIELEAHLHQAQKLEAIGTLAGGIAHDFNNMLASMMGYAELVKFKTTDKGIYPYLEQILKACERSRDLVQQILTFSRKREQEKKPVSITPIVKEALQLLRSSLPATIEIHQHYNAQQDTVLVDSTQIHQIMMNLCTNAVQAMREKKGILEVSVGQHNISDIDLAYDPDLKEGSYLEITVRDTGEGIAPAIKEKIFDPFFTTKAPGDGTGLGLSVVYGIVKDHNGTIAVESEVGKGTIFRIYLPLVVIGEKQDDQEMASIPHGKGCILYVDDEEPIATMGRDWLTTLGYDVQVRFSSHDALEAFRVNPERFGLVITDMTMPNMTGANLAREMLKIRPELPIILTTGFSEQINEEEAKKIGIQEFIMKPVSLSKLAQAVKKTMNENHIPG